MLDKMNVAHTEADTHACNVQSRKRRKDRACGRPAARPAHLFFPKGRKQERKPNERRALAREHKGIILATMISLPGGGPFVRTQRERRASNPIARVLAGDRDVALQRVACVRCAAGGIGEHRLLVANARPRIPSAAHKFLKHH